MSFTVRGYRPADLSALYALDVRCFEQPFRFSRAGMRRFAEDPRAVVQIACEAPAEAPEQVLGFCIVHLEGRGEEMLAYVLTLDVAPERRGAGVATALMRSVESAAAAAGARSVLLHVYVENAGAIRLYERLGYVAIERAEHFYGRGLDALVYGKSLLGDGGTVAPAPDVADGNDRRAS